MKNLYKKNPLELFSWIIIAIGIVFFYWILGNDFTGKKIILAFVIALNGVGFFVNIKHFDTYRKSTYTALMGYYAVLGFMILVTVLAFLEIIK
ncbi:hypothetical protein BBH99_13955 [Chryseobacterium contaminans]|uniref:Uncharacterized protein n=1 Tax=Chryseobacterium contaminans TaxID=1423959 RepID=A0A1M6XRC5_9FLAO|nr:hypothetical protein [Chryseobacterium contaminans]OCA71054.1 hypothetical protein BBH99_13955 [Chryseobacterium contaminans]SHL08550.1 hypothetical protein SAMN05444407_102187 [Chryseobacterium contaminans]